MASLPLKCAEDDSATCIGVAGNSSASNAAIYNLNSTYNNPLLQYTGMLQSQCGVLNDGTSNVNRLPSIDENGCCFFDPKVDNSVSLSKSLPLIITKNELTNTLLSNSNLTPLKDLVCLNKKWGETEAWKHGGVIKENVGVKFGETVIDASLGSTSKPWVQNVISARVTGDLFTSDTPSGLDIGVNDSSSSSTSSTSSSSSSCENGKKAKLCPSGATNQKCSTYVPTKNATSGSKQYYPKSGCRTGGVVSTRNMYGPGTYEVLAMVPKTEWKETDGRGYVFAMWTFHYGEVYWDGLGRDSTGCQVPMCDRNTPPGPVPPSSGVFPAQQYVISDVTTKGLWENTNGPSSANLLVPGFNTPGFTCINGASNITSDDECKTAGGMVIQARGCWDGTSSTTPYACSGGTRPCDPISEDNQQFTQINHEIDIEIPANSPQLNTPNGLHLNMTENDEWKRNLTWGTMNANTWLSDTGNYDYNTTAYYQQAMVRASNYNNNQFVSQNGEYHRYKIVWKGPSADNTDPGKVDFYFDNVLKFSTTKFVPSRAGRFNVGGWPGWWGSGGLSPKFNSADILIAELKITPDTSIATPTRNYPQTYDQVGVRCDTAELLPVTIPPLPNSADTCSGFAQCYWWVILIIVVVIVILMGLGLGLGLKKKSLNY